MWRKWLKCQEYVDFEFHDRDLIILNVSFQNIYVVFLHIDEELDFLSIEIEFVFVKGKKDTSAR